MISQDTDLADGNLLLGIQIHHGRSLLGEFRVSQFDVGGGIQRAFQFRDLLLPFQGPLALSAQLSPEPCGLIRSNLGRAGGRRGRVLAGRKPVDGCSGTLAVPGKARAFVAKAPTMANRVRHAAQERFILQDLSVVHGHDPLHILVHGKVAPETIPQQRGGARAISRGDGGGDGGPVRIRLHRTVRHLATMAGRLWV